MPAFLILLLLLILPAPAQTLQSPVSLLSGDASTAFRYFGPSSGPASGLAEVVPVEGMPFQAAWRLRTLSLPESGVNEWDLRIRAQGAAPVASGDKILAEFWMRCIEPAGSDCVLRLNVERGSSPWTKSISEHYVAGSRWRRYRVLFSMRESYSAGQYWMDFWMAQQVQVAEVGGIQFLNYGPNATPEALGLDRFYEGAAADAAWRKAAEERIDQIRKAEMRVVVTTPEGAPVRGATVHARLKRHAFGWGTAVAAERLLGTSMDSVRYREFIPANFNMAVLENDLKWGPWEQNPNRALEALRWLRENGIRRIRGHNMVWPGWEYMPADLRNLASNPEALRQRILARIRDVGTAVRGQVVDWDVVNEPVANREVLDILGDAVMVEWFAAAREADPDARLFINEFAILSSNGANLRKQNAYYRMIEDLLGRGAPVQGIGLQGHFDSATPPERMLEILDRFARLGLAIVITEYDFATEDEQLQAQFTRDLMTVAFSHPAVTDFLMWGFWEGSHWKPLGAMIRRDWSEKPSYRVWRELIFEKWRTDVQGVTGSNGAFSFRGFHGEYEITVQSGGNSVQVAAQLPRTGQVVRVQVAGAGGGPSGAPSRRRGAPPPRSPRSQ
ncbi:MAG: endo-1,4-beta-xylanase [Bryobacteraceae bacterium]